MRIPRPSSTAQRLTRLVSRPSAEARTAKELAASVWPSDEKARARQASERPMTSSRRPRLTSQSSATCTPPEARSVPSGEKARARTRSAPAVRAELERTGPGVPDAHPAAAVAGRQPPARARRGQARPRPGSRRRAAGRRPGGGRRPPRSRGRGPGPRRRSTRPGCRRPPCRPRAGSRPGRTPAPGRSWEPEQPRPVAASQTSTRPRRSGCRVDAATSRPSGVRAVASRVGAAGRSGPDPPASTGIENAVMTRLRLTSRSRRAPASSAVSWIGVPSGRNATVPGSTMAEVHRGAGPPSRSQAVVPRCSPSKPSVTWPETSSRRPEGSKAIDSPPGGIDPAGRRSSPWSEASAEILEPVVLADLGHAADRPRGLVGPAAGVARPEDAQQASARAIRTGCPAPPKAFCCSWEAIRAASRALLLLDVVQTTADGQDQDHGEHGREPADHQSAMPLRPLPGPVEQAGASGLDGFSAEEPREVVGQLLRRGIARVALLGDGLEDDRLQVAVDPGIDATRRLRGGRPHLLHRLQDRVAPERRPAGQQGVEDRAQAVDVGRRRDLLRSARRPAPGPCTAASRGSRPSR